MKSMLRSFLTLALSVCSGAALQAQITGTVTVPSATYPTLASVVTALNTQGVGTGGAIVNVTAGNNQTAPVDGYQLGSTVLNASLTATKTLTINGNANVITAQVGTKGVVGGGDAIFWLKGTDYVTLDGLKFAESAANTDTTTAMEFGIAIVNLNSAAPFDGANRNTIKNCSITLNNLLAIPSMGIYSAHRTQASTAALAITTAADLHSYNKFYTNTITNVVTGIRMDGYNDVAAPPLLYDKGNDIGGTTAATGNTITNFGGSNYTSIGGVTAVYQDSTNVSYNTINDTANGGVGPVGAVWGIYVFGTNSNFTTNNNNIVMASASVNTTYFIYGIYTNALGTNLTAQNNNMYLTQVTGSGVTVYGIFQPNGNNLTAQNNNITVNKGVVGTVGLVYTTVVGTANINSNIFKVTHPVAFTTGTYYGVFASSTAVAYNINANSFDNFDIKNTGTLYLIYASSPTPIVNINSNKITGTFSRPSTSGGTYMIYNLGGPASGTSTITGNNFSNVTTGGTGAVYGIYLNTVAAHSHIVVNDTLSNWTAGGAGIMYGIYVASGAANIISNNLVSNITTTYNGTCYGIYAYSGATGTGVVGANTVRGFTNGGSPNYGLYLAGANNAEVFENNISNVSTGAATGGIAYGLYVNGGTTGAMNVYNNFISDIKAPSASGTSPVYGAYITAGNDVRLYHNTINLSGTSTGANFGATGIYYAAAAINVDLRNNIIRADITPKGTGTAVAVRRSTGTAGIAPANLNTATSGNILYTPTATNSYLYGESTTTTMVNGFNLTNDPAFNTSCGLYKTFMTPREAATFTENNLSQIGTTATFAPSGTSFAESGAVPVSPLSITTDYSRVTRSNPADIGALQFAGTASGDVAAPTINYTVLPATTYCNTPPTLIAAITDATGVNNTAGTAPRLYYKKSGDANAFGVANTSAGNGWKWVEATTVSAGNYTFNFDYTKLQAAVAIGDSITYFVIAQDTRPTPNVGANIAAFPTGFCPASVNLPAGAAPIGMSPKPNGYKILAIPAFTARASVKSICVSGVSELSLTPLPVGATLQWQRDNGTSTFTDIAGATSAVYSVSGITATNRFRAQIKCGTAVIATSSEDTVTVISPQVVTTTPASRCGVGTVTLGATGTNLKWYDQASGGTPVATGTSFTTPSISNTTTYYVAAATAGGSANLGLPAAINATTGNNGWTEVGLMFNALTPFVLQSVVLYPQGTGAATVTIALKNSAGTILQSATVNVNATAAPGLPTVATLNFAVPVGTGHRLVTNGVTGAITYLNRESSTANFSYPYTLPGVASITSAYTSGASSSYYYYFYNWSIGADCESNRVPVVATVGAAPPITVTATPPAICPGSSSTVGVTSANTNYGYVWSSGQTTASFSVTPAATTKYVVTATDPVTSCVNKDSVTVTVVNQTASITPSAAQNICIGNSVTLSANTGTGLSYEWFNGGVSIPGATSSTYAATLAGAYTVKVTNIASGCGTTSNPVTVNVFAAPTATISPSGNLTLCSGSTLTLTGPTGTGYTYQWKNGASNATGASTGISYNATAAGTYTLVVSANGCSTTSAPATVSVLPLPLVVMSPSAPAAACDSVVLSSTNSNVTFQWNYNNAPVIGATNATYAAAVTGNYSLTATSTINGCAATSTPVAITINQSPAAVITYSSPITFCEGSAVVLNTYSGANLVYDWRNNNNSIPGATANSYTTNTTGNYSVRVSNSANGCARISPVVSVRVNPLPSPVITYNGTSNVLSTTQPYAQYQWLFNNQQIGGATQRNYSPQQSGAYLVIVTDENGCINQSLITFVNGVGIANTPLGKAISIYPNPTTGLLYVKSPVDVSLSLRDVTGKVVATGTDKSNIDLVNLADGMYLLFITDKAGQLVRAEKITKASN